MRVARDTFAANLRAILRLLDYKKIFTNENQELEDVKEKITTGTHQTKES